MEFVRIVKFDKIIRNLNILRAHYENYRYLADPRRNFLVFPNQNLFNTIIRRAEELNEFLNSQNKSDIEIYKSYIPLSDSLVYIISSMK